MLVPDIEFTSLLFPFLAHADRGVEVIIVGTERLVDAIDPTITMVAFSAVQSAIGEVADVEAIADAARQHGVLTAVDATQACGWLPLDDVDAALEALR